MSGVAFGKDMEPVLLRPVYKDYLWGGSAIAGRFRRSDAPAQCAESWEVSTHEDGMSLVEGGAFDGATLGELCDAFGGSLLGSWCESSSFPLLVKLIDASKRLSVQVHPGDEAAEKFGGEAKTEMWYFIDAADGAMVCAGLKKGVTPRVFSDAVKARTVPSLLRTVKAERGKALYVPGGLVHAICEGCFVLEVQQRSNTTWRVDDWGRVAADGKPRPLHVARAMEVIDWHAPAVSLSTPYSMPSASPSNLRERVLRSDYFSMERWTLSGPERFVQDGSSFRVLFALSGDFAVKTPSGAEFEIPFGRSCLVPARMGECTVSPRAGTASEPETVLSITL